MSNALLILTACVLFPGAVIWILHERRRVERREVNAKAAADDLFAQIQALDAEKRDLAEFAKWYRDLFDHCSTMLLAFGIGQDGLPTTFREANAEACSALEYDQAKLTTLTPLDIETVEDPAARPEPIDLGRMVLGTQDMARNSGFAVRNMQCLIKRAQAGEAVTHTTSFITRGGRRIPVAVTALASELRGETIIIYNAVDLTAQQLAERDIREAELRFKLLFANALHGIALYDSQHELMHVNAAGLRMFGTPDPYEFGRYPLLDSERLSERHRSAVRRGETVRTELCIDFTELVNAGNLVSSRKSTGYFDVQVENLGKDEANNPRGILVQFMDVTELREAEALVVSSDQQLRQARKMEAIGTMAGGIAHDFNNILSPILGYSEIGMELCQADHQLHEFMREIHAASVRAKELVHQILIFSRQDETVNSEIHLTPIVKEVAKQQKATLPPTIEVSSVIRGDADLVLANPTQIHQVITNLCTNAAYAMKDSGGILELRISQFHLAWRHRYEFPDLKKGHYLRLSIRDTGSGMDEETRKCIFEPFFSTKPRGEGTGMGLAVVQGIVNSLGGGIAVESKPGAGTTVHIALPLIEIASESAPEEEVIPPAEHERILFVDDETSITRMADHMFASLGYAATVVSSSKQALDIFRQDPDSFDLLITDQVMPGMTGAELITAIRAIRPNLPVVVCSGFCEQFTPEVAAEMGIQEFLMKPVERRQLAAALHRALHHASDDPDDAPEASQPPPPDEQDDDTIILPRIP